MSLDRRVIGSTGKVLHTTARTLLSLRGPRTPNCIPECCSQVIPGTEHVDAPISRFIFADVLQGGDAPWNYGLDVMLFELTSIHFIARIGRVLCTQCEEASRFTL